MVITESAVSRNPITMIKFSFTYLMSNELPPTQTRAKEIFSKASPEQQELIRTLLASEREVVHMKVKKEIHKSFYEHVRRIIK